MHKRRASKSLESSSADDKQDEISELANALTYTKIASDDFYICTLPLKFTWAKCAKCKTRIITEDRCNIMYCGCIYCNDCSFYTRTEKIPHAHCIIHKKIEHGSFHWYRNPNDWYDSQIFNSINMPIYQVVENFKPSVIADLTRARRLSSNAVDYALFYKEEETYAAAVDIVKSVAKNYFAFGLTHVQISKIKLANIHYLYQLLKRAHIHVVTN